MLLSAGGRAAGSRSWRGPPKATCKGLLRDRKINARNDYLSLKLISDECHKALQWLGTCFGILWRSKSSDFVKDIFNKYNYQETSFQNLSTAPLWQLWRLFWLPRQSDKGSPEQPQNHGPRCKRAFWGTFWRSHKPPEVVISLEAAFKNTLFHQCTSKTSSKALLKCFWTAVNLPTEPQEGSQSQSRTLVLVLLKLLEEHDTPEGLENGFSLIY